ncbi:uncharacterized protein B0I36DRAFT_77713 [Microdochium trichocladiopsis]|uniref:Uncharacterized protein n=1 Tax=Microdochium trichocladiopsis TaxID=1682393 RepID=A0A9P9BV97_9PEZI|nr:uncharacterized protein B0I36DRAFT_77713 [Microdochium trichocladiopsis]KAH7038279.1 hypothetical protein B0I36DRAFT_77713 [Microdochium trichocladiopsis]
MTDFTTNTGFLKALYAGNALWHTSAFYHFTFKQPFMIRKLSQRRTSTDPAVQKHPSGDAWHHDVMAYLGAINTSSALLAIIRLHVIIARNSNGGKKGGGGLLGALSTGTARGDVPLDVTALAVLGLANFSQAYMNFYTGWTSDRWIMGTGLDRITVLDALFTVLDWFAAWRLVKSVSGV